VGPWITGLGLIGGTILVHVAGFRMVLTWLDRRYAGDRRPRPGIGRIMIFASLTMAILHHLEAALWASVYIGLGILDEWDTAVYFSFVTMTTVGYGDVTLTGDWRLLAALQGMNGMLLSGLSAAFLFAILQHYWTPIRGNG
jgi:voltage-gated potassium channel